MYCFGIRAIKWTTFYLTISSVKGMADEACRQAALGNWAGQYLDWPWNRQLVTVPIRLLQLIYLLHQEHPVKDQELADVPIHKALSQGLC